MFISIFILGGSGSVLFRCLDEHIDGLSSCKRNVFGRNSEEVSRTIHCVAQCNIDDGIRASHPLRMECR